MSLVADICRQIYDTPFATAIRESEVSFSLIETVHVLGLALIVGTIALVDLRLLGALWRDVPAKDIEHRVVPVTWAGFAVMAASGALLFVAEAAKVQDNPAFRVKLALLALAGVNVLLFHLFLKRRLEAETGGREITWLTRASAGASLVIWAGVIAAGRAIAYFHGGAA